MKIFTVDEINHQKVFKSEHWNVILPSRPIVSNHLLFVIKDTNKQLFTDLTEGELVDLAACIALVIEKVKAKYGNDFDGFNLFSNNGSVRIGQHVQHFHQHIFLRFVSEEESPYSVMAKQQNWHTLDTPEWVDQRDSLRDLLNL